LIIVSNILIGRSIGRMGDETIGEPTNKYSPLTEKNLNYLTPPCITSGFLNWKSDLYGFYGAFIFILLDHIRSSEKHN
jgi:hypothetical protein